MSSHHIVRDEQEPALLMLNTENCEYDHLSQLLEWSPVVVATEHTLSQLLAWGIKIDIVFTSPEKQELVHELTIFQRPIKIFATENNQWTEALHYLSSNKHKAINIYTDKLPEIADQVACFANDIDLVLYNSQEKGVFSRNGKFEKWVAKGTQFKIPADLIAEYYNLNHLGNQVWEASVNGTIRIEANKDFFLIEM
ncbi:hypothetical protein V6R21_26440 [Limibacter armeniacum]|uniref:hypothetical protein n=1 Tax=Limibacter armeniacum TaxID=466084 RepID=UPI002FE5008A